jgi:uncharacterized DUF497 family protein
MRFEWDEEKRLTNIRKHGIDFLDAIQIFDGYTVTIEDTRFDYGETRYLTLGMMHSLIVILMVHTDEENVMRIISARKAERHETRRYFE